MSEKLTQKEIKEKIALDALSYLYVEGEAGTEGILATIDSLERKYGKHHYKILDKDARAYYSKDKRGLGKFSVDTSALPINNLFETMIEEGGHWMQYANQPQSVRDSLTSEGVRQLEEYGDTLRYNIKHQTLSPFKKYILPKEYHYTHIRDFPADIVFRAIASQGKSVLDYLIQNPKKIMLGLKGALMAHAYDKSQEKGAPTIEWQAHEEKAPEFMKEFSAIADYYTKDEREKFWEDLEKDLEKDLKEE